MLLSPRVEVTAPPAAYTADEASVWDVLANGAADIDTISVRAHLTTVRCLAAVTSLESREPLNAP